MHAHPIILAGLIFFAAHLLSAVTGFGANILGLPLLALVVGLDAGKQSLIVLGALMYAYLTIRWWDHVNLRQLRLITLVAGAGLIVGMATFTLLPARAGTLLLALFVIAVGLRGVFNLAPGWRTPRWAGRLLLFLGGVVHGAFTTGGPLLVVYCRQALPGKSTFRSTLAVMWLILAAGLIAGWTVTGTWDPDTPRISLFGLPFLLLGLAAGEYLHHRVNEQRFARAVNAALIIIGAILLWTQLLGAAQ